MSTKCCFWGAFFFSASELFKSQGAVQCNHILYKCLTVLEQEMAAVHFKSTVDVFENHNGIMVQGLTPPPL